MIPRKAKWVPLCLAAAMSPAYVKAADHTIIQKDKGFSQTSLTIKKGDTVTFKNEDEITHNVFSLGPINAFELKTQAPKSSSTVSFKDAGTTPVECAIHPGMKLTITVE